MARTIENPENASADVAWLTFESAAATSIARAMAVRLVSGAAWPWPWSPLWIALAPWQGFRLSSKQGTAPRQGAALRARAGDGSLERS